MIETKKNTPILDTVASPADLHSMSHTDLKKLAAELRQEVIESVSETGGHLGASLGVVELTVAIHSIFDTPRDRLIWDVGHQCYPHKIITGRRDQMHTLRQAGGLSGFTKRKESEYDPFGAAHSSTSISAGLGMAVARDLKGEDKRDVICVIGDGAMSAGMAYEAMNNAGHLGSRLFVILNDNEMSIARPVGAMSAYLSRLISSPSYQYIRNIGKDIASKLPDYLADAMRKAEHYARGMLTGGTMFEELGFHYIGPVDGHKLDHLRPILQNLKDMDLDRPVLVHAVTQKGKGYPPAEAAADKYHGVSKFDLVTGAQAKSKSTIPSYTNIFAESLIEHAEKDDKIVAITAAMPTGTGLHKFMEKYPTRTFDVGIAEQHAVTFAAGLATEGFKPFAAIYSTFLQRAYDQVVHDVAIQNLPVRFAIDRAGLVGADGPTHAGAFDVTYLASLPNFVVMAAADELELKRMVATCVGINDRPSAVRYPRGNGIGLDLDVPADPLQIGKGRVVKNGTKIAILSLGARLQEALKAADHLDSRGLSTTVADARFAKPIDEDLVRTLAAEHDVLITLEENAIGGFAAQVMQMLAMEGLLDDGLRVRPMMLPDVFINHDTPEKMYALAGLDAEHIVAMVLKALGQNDIRAAIKA